ncbi:immunoglobulin-like domain-containing protein, partial [Psychromonas aquatilis]
ASVDNAPVDTPLVVTLDNGETITIAVGDTTGSVTFANPNGDDAYVDGEELTYAIDSATGGNYEALNSDATSTVTVSDTLDTSKVTLSSNSAEEGTEITITATVDNAPEETDLVLTLNNGEQITIVVGQTEGRVTFDNPNEEDVYLDAEALEYSIVESNNGGNYEALDTSSKTTVTVTDTSTATVVSLSDSTVAEGTDITITATVSDAPQGDDLVLTLDNGEFITITAGQTTGSVSFTNPNTEDTYLDADTQTVGISASTGGNYETLNTNAVATITVTDTIATTTISLDNPTVEEGGEITISASVDNAPADTPLVVTLDNGETITIDVGATTGSVTFANPNGDDAYVDGEELTYTIDSATGGNYEALNSDVTSTVTVSDTIDTSKVTLSSNNVEEGTDITIIATVDNAPEGTDLIVYLNNGQELTISAGHTTGSVTFANPNEEDVYVDGEELTYAIDSATGGNYEALNSDATSTVTVSDTLDTSKVTLSSNSAEEGTDITITATVDNAPEETDLVLTLNNGEQITIAVGQTEGRVTFDNPNGEDVYLDAEALEYSIVESNNGGNYEALDTSSKTTVTVTDTSTVAVVSLSDNTVAEGTDITITATVSDAPQGDDLVLTLDNGEFITITAGQTTGSVSFTNPNTEDTYLDADTQTVGISASTGGNYETLNTDAVATITVTDTIATTTISLDNPTVEEGGEITISASVDNAPVDTPLVVTLDNGETITIAVGDTTGSVTFANPNGDDAYVDGEELTYAIDSATGGNYEALNSDATSTVTVSDTKDTSKVTLSSNSVEEGTEITITATVDNAPEETDLVLTLNNGEQITIVVGQTEGRVTFDNPNGEDVYLDAEALEYSIVESNNGGNYEALETSSKTTVTVADTSTTAVVSLSD